MNCTTGIFNSKSLCLWLGFPLILLSITACIDDTPSYETTYDKSQGSHFKGATLCIARFSGSERLEKTGGGLLGAVVSTLDQNATDAEIARRLVAMHLSFARKALARKFTLVDSPACGATEKSGILPTDFGLAVDDKFGWTWAPQRSGIADYRADICSSIFDKHGKEVWKFCSSSTFMKSDFSLDSLMSGVAGSAPSPDTIAGVYRGFFDYYSRFILRLIEEDEASAAHKTSFVKYFRNLPSGFYITTMNTTSEWVRAEKSFAYNVVKEGKDNRRGAPPDAR